MKKILVVDDEPSLRDLVELVLKREKYEVATAADGKTALAMAEAFKPDLILLDIMLPDMSGHQVCKQLNTNKRIPTIMVTARHETIDKVLGLELGADDYVTKPFEIMELLARIKALLRRANKEEEAESITHLELKLDIANMAVYKNEEEIVLTAKEYQLLELMARNMRKTFSRDELLQKVWGYDYMGDSRVVDICIARLRKKIEDDSGSPAHIVTVFGLGYRFGG
ncbi:response regulator transcription factor [Ruminiclostridium cellobioparum]|uniref:Stage 0 sporulation protein A homolog n=1 Tax=Ruminiclostridium cellobioparum subsp. termitidis CT1112 TaxID=1195236 RepID=S0FX50_RUMCE|nr:response regulator transcription factor [Ruminiclostridium cellobioparum]EMS73734.1 two component transcriptional regulator, winged helix family protein [Ruminiclostridium cellobioparum subsp. termitidis CT1112]